MTKKRKLPPRRISVPGMRQVLLTIQNAIANFPEAVVSLEYLTFRQKGPRRTAVLLGRARAMVLAGWQASDAEWISWQILLDWLQDHPEDIEGISAKHFAWLVRDVTANGGWFAINRM
jgi:hypothetical protein